MCDLDAQARLEVLFVQVGMEIITAILIIIIMVDLFHNTDLTGDGIDDRRVC